MSKLARNAILIAGGLPALVLVGFYLGWLPWGEGYRHWREAQAALQRRDFPTANEHLEKCVTIWPDDPTTLLLAASTARRQRKFDRAWQLLSLAGEKQANVDALMRERDLLRMHQGNLAGAEKVLAQCKTDPRSAQTREALEAAIQGMFWAAAGRTWEPDDPGLVAFLEPMRWAVRLWLEGSESHPDKVQGLVWRGRMHTIAGEYPEAVTDFREAVDLDPDHYEARLLLALSISQESPPEAAVHLQYLHDRWPEDQSVCLHLALTRSFLGQLQEARQLLDGLLAENPRDIPAVIARAKLALDAREFADAEKRLRQALEYDPENADLHATLSRCLRAVNKTEEARKHQERFDELEKREKANPPKSPGTS